MFQYFVPWPMTLSADICFYVTQRQQPITPSSRKRTLLLSVFSWRAIASSSAFRLYMSNATRAGPRAVVALSFLCNCDTRKSQEVTSTKSTSGIHPAVDRLSCAPRGYVYIMCHRAHAMSDKAPLTPRRTMALELAKTAEVRRLPPLVPSTLRVASIAH